jgi:hypothetical protein
VPAPLSRASLTRVAALLLAVTVTSPPGAAQDSPAPSLPDARAFIASVRARLRTDEELQAQYTYLEKRQQIRVSKTGKVALGDLRLFEVYPSTEPGETYRRLIAVNGTPLPPDELERRDAARRKLLSDRLLIRERETPAERAKREAKAAAERQRREELVDDVFRVFAVELVGRDTIEGHGAIVAALTPRPGVRTRSRAGRYFPRFRGRAWVSERDHQVMKVELEAIDDILVGWGIMGRIHDGSRLLFERRKVNDEVWLPARSVIEMGGRSLLFRRFQVSATTEFSDYRKFSVQAQERYEVPGGTITTEK